MRIPGVTSPGTTTAVPISSIDFRPTLLEICGIDETVDDVDGISILPVLKDNNGVLDRDDMYWHYPHYGNQGGAPSGAIRMGDWKLIQWFEDDSVELFNLRQDIGEKKNLAQEYPELVARLRSRLSEWQKSIGANMPQPNPDFNPQNEAKHHRNADKASQTGPWR